MGHGIELPEAVLLRNQIITLLAREKKQNRVVNCRTTLEVFLRRRRLR